MSHFWKLENMLDIKKSDEKKSVEKKSRLKVAVGQNLDRLKILVGRNFSHLPNFLVTFNWFISDKVSRRPNIEMAEYRDGRISRWPNIEMAEYWPNIEMAKHRDGRISRWPNIDMAEYRNCWKTRLPKMIWNKIILLEIFICSIVNKKCYTPNYKWSA